LKLQEHNVITLSGRTKEILNTIPKNSIAHSRETMNYFHF